MKLAFLTIGLVIISANYSISGRSSLNAPSVPLAHQECSNHSDCVLIQLDCGDCDCGTPVNKKYEPEHKIEKENRCAGFRGPICDLLCPSTASICQDGKCAEN